MKKISKDAKRILTVIATDLELPLPLNFHRPSKRIQKRLFLIAVKKRNYDAIVTLHSFFGFIPSPITFYNICRAIGRGDFSSLEGKQLIELLTTPTLATSIVRNRTMIECLMENFPVIITPSINQMSLDEYSTYYHFQAMTRHLEKMGIGVDTHKAIRIADEIETVKSETERRLLKGLPPNFPKAAQWQNSQVVIALLQNTEDENADSDIYFAHELHKAFVALKKERHIPENVLFYKFTVSEASLISKQVDGVIIPGNSRSYELDKLNLMDWQKKGSYSKADAANLAVAKLAKFNKIPYFGVCAGMQLITLTHGGKLEQVPNEIHFETHHEIVPTAGSWIEKAITINNYSDVSHLVDPNSQTPHPPLTVRSHHRHSTIVDEMGESLAVQAFEKSDPNHAEAIVSKVSPMWGIQFHPEYDLNQENTLSTEQYQSLQNILIYFVSQVVKFHYQRMYCQMILNYYGVCTNQSQFFRSKDIQNTFKQHHDLIHELADFQDSTSILKPTPVWMSLK